MQEPNLEHQAQQLLRHRPGSIDAVFLARALRALEELIQNLPKDALSAAAGASTDLGAVLLALLAARNLEMNQEEDPLLRARLRGQQARLGLLNREGGTISAVRTNCPSAILDLRLDMKLSILNQFSHRADGSTRQLEHSQRLGLMTDA